MAETNVLETPSSPIKQQGGMSRFMSDVTASLNKSEDAPPAPKEPEPTPAKPVEPAKPEAAKPAAETPKPEATKPQDKPATPSKPEPAAELRKRKEELEKIERELRKELEAERKSKSELASKKFWTDEDQKEREDYRKRIAELQRERDEVAYERSDEFKQKFIEPYQSRLKNAIESTVKYFPVINEEGAPGRPATEADFWAVAQSPLSQRAAVAAKLFGHNAANIIADIRRLEEIKQDSDNAIRSHREGFETREKEGREKSQSYQKKLLELQELSRKQLAEEFKEFFSDPTDDPELAEAWKSGNSFLKSLEDRLAANDMTIEEQAAFAEVTRARAAWFPRGVKQVKRLQAKLTELEAELAKFRSSDPGNEKEKGKMPLEQKNDLGGGARALASKFDNLGQ